MRMGETFKAYAGSTERVTRSRIAGRVVRLWLSRILIKLLLIDRESTFVLLSQIQAFGGLIAARVLRLDSSFLRLTAALASRSR